MMKKLLPFLAALLLLCVANAFAQEEKEESVKEMDSTEFQAIYGDSFYQQLSCPPEALENKLTGTADVSFTLTAEGKITGVKVERSTLPGVKQQLGRIDRQTMRLTPYEIDGTPQRVNVKATIDYSRVAGPEAKNMTFADRFQEPLFLNPKTGKTTGTDQVYALLNDGFKLPAELKKQSVNQRIDLRFNVSERGQISDIHVTSDTELLNKLVADLLAQPTEWFAAYVNGEPVPYTVMTTVWMTLDKKGREKAPFNKDDCWPRFIDGSLEYFGLWVVSHLVYPGECEKKQIEGRVVVRYTVMSDGTIGDEITILETPHPLLAEEVIRVMKKSPKWKPAVFNGQPVDICLNLPIIFKLPGKQ